MFTGQTLNLISKGKASPISAVILKAVLTNEIHAFEHVTSVDSLFIFISCKLVVWSPNIVNSSISVVFHSKEIICTYLDCKLVKLLKIPVRFLTVSRAIGSYDFILI